jgi:hygromycin-B 7''-O-kinase
VTDGLAEPWSVAAARRRLRQLPLDVPSGAEFVGGASNDVWRFSDVVLRVCWRADRGRLLREARLLEALPPEIPHAPVVGSGRTEDLSWMLSRHVPGTPLEPADRAGWGQLAAILRELHAWTPPPALFPPPPAGDAMAIWAAELVPLPAQRALALVELAKALPHVDPALIDAAAERIRGLDFVDDGPQVVVHGDAVPGNVLVHDGRITALLDFEWTRPASRDLELVSLVRAAQSLDAPILRWLEDDYPELFAAPDLDRRLWLYELVYILRGIVWWPPDAPESRLTPEHHVHTLRRLLDGPFSR